MLRVDDHVEVTEPGAPHYGRTGTVVEATPESITIRFTDGSELAAKPDEVRRIQDEPFVESLVHDPFCPTASATPLEQALDGAWLCRCNFITKVRADERVAALRDAANVIEALPCRCNENLDYCDGHTAAITAIETLGQQT